MPPAANQPDVSGLGLLNSYAIVFIVAFIVTLLVTPLVRQIALRANVTDRPDADRKIHKYPVAYLGGMAVFAGLIAAIAVSYFVVDGVADSYLGVPFAVILGTHFVIDRWRLARYVVWAKNWMAPWPREVVKVGDLPVGQLPNRMRPNPPFSLCQATGYPPSTPDWMAVWLMIIADNTAHIILNGLALHYL